jgi:hypothetical protein
MFTTAFFNPQLKEMYAATAAQLAKFIELKAARADRFLHAEMQGKTLVMHWRTKTGYFVQCTFDETGARTDRKFYRNWNETDNKPFNPVIIK